MKTLSTHTPQRMRPGLTLIELTVIILVFMAFLSMIFIGVGAWKRGSDRSGCILNIRHVQMAVRGYANTNQLQPGDNTFLLSPPVDLEDTLIGVGSFIPSEPQCPGNGLYTLGGDNIPPLGSLYMSCSLEASDGHVPEKYGSW